MLKRKQFVLVFSLVAILLTIFGVLARCHCPPQGIAFTEERRNFHRLKNRTALPQPNDFETRVTLAGLLQAGEDRTRWSTSRAARIEGYVVSIGEAGVELANCYVRRDIHINIALHPQAPVSQQLVMEITPRMQDWAAARGWDWSEERLNGDLVGRWCLFEGWLFFDTTHAGESENIAPGRKGNWRATAWEIHPITNFQVIGAGQ